ncbi:response regulator transcription factor [Planomonospora sp. ID91781]|uniref:response regulator transcription factor n=1 Tax=Planomonospora sp. ID91781 TaxID=2738135 RepID=UPI0018C44E6D|nr:response regulator transcription factor [Planomonospora sp. ID91781]MBG0823134.1 response regulator transcription factor [Planomonospora sp. ID91781]
MRVLVVEDEEIMAEAVGAGLRRHGFAVDVALDGVGGLERALGQRYDVIVLDRDLPGMHGDEVCRRVVAGRTGARVLMLTAAGGLSDRVAGLNLGADDYLPKPFAFAEVVARIDALVRRGAAIRPPVLEIGDLTVDTPRRRVVRGGRAVNLTAKEFGVLAVLAAEPEVVVSAEELLERVWDENADPFTNAVRVTMVGLRRKLGDPPVIETVRAAGYRLLPGPAAGS